jgi:glycine betaine/proline transport system ATP-binding protein
MGTILLATKVVMARTQRPAFQAIAMEQIRTTTGSFDSTPTSATTFELFNKGVRMANLVLEVKNLYKIFGHNPQGRALPMVVSGKSKKEILEETGCTVGINNASFQVEKGEIFVIMGLSGSGKSTVIRCLNRLIEPTEGEVLVDGKDITRLSQKELRHIRRKTMSMVFQRFGLLPHRTVIDNVAYGLEVQNIEKADRYAQAKEAIETVGLSGYEDQMTQALSGGMQQRVGLARALANDPEILLMDEAFSALDPLIRVQLQDELLELQARLHKTIIFITHDLDEALKLGCRIAIMKDGKIVQIGTPEDILTFPADDYVKDFVENVDRSKVLTAESILRKTETGYDSYGPHQTIRKMKSFGSSTLYIVDSNRNYCGYVTIEDVTELAKMVKPEDDESEHKHIKSVIRTDLPTARPDTVLSELIADASKTSMPIPILAEDRHFRGIVARPALLAALSGD